MCSYQTNLFPLEVYTSRTFWPAPGDGADAFKTNAHTHKCGECHRGKFVSGLFDVANHPELVTCFRCTVPDGTTEPVCNPEAADADALEYEIDGQNGLHVPTVDCAGKPGTFVTVRLPADDASADPRELDIAEVYVDKVSMHAPLECKASLRAREGCLGRPCRHVLRRALLMPRGCEAARCRRMRARRTAPTRHPSCSTKPTPTRTATARYHDRLELLTRCRAAAVLPCCRAAVLPLARRRRFEAVLMADDRQRPGRGRQARQAEKH